MSNPASEEVTAGQVDTVTSESKRLRGLRVLVPSVFFVAALTAVILAVPLSDIGRRFPLFIALAMMLVSVVVIFQELKVMRKKGEYSAAAYDYQMLTVDSFTALHRGFLWILLIIAFISVVWLLGFFIAAGIWISLSLRFGAGVKWKWAVLSALIGIFIIWLLVSLLSLPMPSNLLELIM